MLQISRYFGFILTVSLVMLMGLATGCSGVFQAGDGPGSAAPPSASNNPGVAAGNTGAAVSGGLDPAAQTPTATPSVISSLPKVSIDAVALSVLITPLDAGFVEIAGERTLSSGQATEVNRNDQINLIARPTNPAQWKFSRWGGDLQGPHASESLIMDSSKKIRAVFVKVDAPRVESANFYKLTVNGQAVRNVSLGLSNGSVVVSPPPGTGDAPYPEGTTVSLTATANEGHRFTGWTGDCGGQGTCAVIMNNDINVVATFSPRKVELSTSVDPAQGGAISPVGTNSYEFKSVVTVVPEPAEGFQFQSWSGDCTGSEECTVTMDENRSVTALFALVEWTLVVSVTPPNGGTVTSVGSSAHQHGSEIALQAAPAQGFEFSEWSGDCQGNGDCDLTMNGDKTVTAVFVPVASPTVTQ